MRIKSWNEKSQDVSNRVKNFKLEFSISLSVIIQSCFFRNHFEYTTSYSNSVAFLSFFYITKNKATKSSFLIILASRSHRYKTWYRNIFDCQHIQKERPCLYPPKKCARYTFIRAALWLNSLILTASRCFFSSLS